MIFKRSCYRNIFNSSGVTENEVEHLMLLKEKEEEIMPLTIDIPTPSTPCTDSVSNDEERSEKKSIKSLKTKVS